MQIEKRHIKFKRVVIRNESQAAKALTELLMICKQKRHLIGSALFLKVIVASAL